MSSSSPLHTSQGPDTQYEGGNGQQDEALSILVVEDEPMMRRSLCELLRPQGYKVYEAASGLEAKEALGSGQFHIALIDLNLPDCSGHKLIEHVRQGKLSTKMIVVSGESSFENAAHALQNGVFDFVSKPFDVSYLLKTIKKAAEEIAEINEVNYESQTIKLSDEINRLIVDNSPDFIYILDENGYFVFVNQTSKELIGCPPEDLIGTHYTSIVYKQDLNKACYIFNERRTGDRSTKGIELRLNKVGSNGSSHAEAGYIYIELIAKGIYKNDEIHKSNFIGTYGVIRDITERKRSEEVINYHLYHDNLTSLPNRSLFNDRLHMALLYAKRNKQKLALMFLDLDRFKKINDNFGHQAGDEILQAVAHTLKGCVREMDTLARIGGDEFLLITQDLSSPEDAVRICEKILNKLKQPIMYRGNEIRITASVGVALYPDHGKTKDELIRHADMAMYRVKEVSCNGYCFYNDAFNVKDFPNLELENDLYSALLKNEMVLYYQPQIEAVNERVVGVEALIRWNHPKYGIITPSHFIPIAEQNGLINELGKWGLHQACQDTKELEAEGYSPLKTSFNVSVQQLHNPNFVQEVLEIVHGCCLNQNSIELEITESSLMHNLQKASAMLKLLTEGKISVAIDDFGSGYSSLNYLQNLSINTLKLDRAFIQNANLASSEKTIFTAIQSMAKSLDVNFVVEGVETTAQKLYLEKLGFSSIIQGYYYSHPIPFSELKAFILNQNGIDA